MARLTNEEIRRMSLDEADAYTDAHPAEAWLKGRDSRSRARDGRSGLITTQSRP